MTGKIHSCGYQDSGIAHNCCYIVDILKKRIELLSQPDRKLRWKPNPELEACKIIMLQELEKILEGKK